MNRDFKKGFETVKVNFFEPNIGGIPQDAQISNLTLPVLFNTGDVALAAMVKGLKTYYLDKIQEQDPNGNLSVHPELLNNLEEVLTGFYSDIEKHNQAKAPKVIL